MLWHKDNVNILEDPEIVSWKKKLPGIKPTGYCIGGERPGLSLNSDERKPQRIECWNGREHRESRYTYVILKGKASVLVFWGQKVVCFTS